MSRRVTLCLGLAICATLATAHPTVAQRAAHAPVRRGDVSGVELQLEGALGVSRGQSLRWLLTAYEVVGLDDLRPAPGAQIRVLTSLDPREPAADLQADAHGRALAEIAVPDDAPGTFRAVIEVHARVGAQRRFELDVHTMEPRVLSLTAAPPSVPPEGTIRAWGRLSHRTTRAGLEGEAVQVVLEDERGRPLLAPSTVTTDAAGVFVYRARVPRDVLGSVRVRARTGEDEHRLETRAGVSVAEPPSPALLVAVAPERVVTRSRDRIDVEVVVRRPDGRPVEEALLQVSGVPRDEERRILTDARGRARFRWRAPEVTTGFRDAAISVSAARAGLGAGQGQAMVRTTAVDHAIAVAVEGGTLPSSLGGRLFVRVAGVDGRPAGAGVPVHLQGPRLPQGGLDVTTGDDGLAVFEIELVPPREDANDRCGGEAATALDVRAGQGAGAAQGELCVPIDPDAAARVRAEPAVVQAGEAVRFEVARARDAERAPVAVTLLSLDGGQVRAVAATVLPSREARGELTVPRDVVGQVVVRARPLIGAAQHEVRGSSTSLWVVPDGRMTAAARLDGAARRVDVQFGGDASDARSTVAVAFPLPVARAIHDRARARQHGELGDLRVPEGDASDDLIRAALAARTPIDVGAPGVVRGREVVAVPAPTAPERVGLLRDPWRARARFVSGRLALLFRAIEAHVTASVPEHIERVAVQNGARFRFNDQLLSSLGSGSSLGSAGATGLGGEPLTIEELERLDRAFTYDNVARRITRQRLFRMLLALRHFVRQNALDLSWAWSGDPTEWIAHVRDQYFPGVGHVPARDTVDAWGRPFELRPVSRARFAQLAPVPGFELVSAGPDGRYGNGDDVVDPTARVLPSDSLYGRAVGEDALVARLGGVELGRATLQNAASMFSVGRPSIRAPDEGGGQAQAAQLWQLPSLIEPDPHALDLRRPRHPGDGAGGSLERFARAGGAFELDLDDEPRTWGVVVESWTPGGASAVALASATSGLPLLVQAPLPARMRTREPLTIEVFVTNAGAADASYGIRAQGEGGLELEAPGAVDVPAGQWRRVPVRVRATRTGAAGAAISLTEGGRDLRTVRGRVEVDLGMHPLRRRASGLVTERWRADLAIPSDASGATGRLVLLAPAALSGDPDLADLRREDPALVAWARALAGRAPDPAVRARLLRAQQPGGLVDGAEPGLSTACALLAWSFAGADDEEASSARDLAAQTLGGLPPMGDDDPSAGRLRTHAAALAALAVSGVSAVEEPETRFVDPVSRQLSSWLPELRRALHDYPGEPTLLARAAAALLLADPRDGHGRAMVIRAAEALAPTPGGGAVVRPSDDRRSDEESLSATLALAVAAHQVGDAELAARLSRGAFQRDNVLWRLGGETAFWALATAAFGVLGDGATEATVSIGGAVRTVELAHGQAVVELPDLGAGSERRVRVETEDGAALIARVEAVFGRPFAEEAQGAEAGPFRLSLQGDVGEVGGVAALELSVGAARSIRTPVVDLQLPAAIGDEDRLVERLEANGSVLRVERRSPGYLRLHLRPLAAEQEAAIPLPIPWAAYGRVRGLGVVAYPSARPRDMSVLPPRVLDVLPAD